jgi:hypothetical protein
LLYLTVVLAALAVLVLAAVTLAVEQVRTRV